MIQPTRFAEFNIVAVSGGQLHRVAKVVFQKRDGSIFVMFPSFAHNEGFVGELSMKAGAQSASYGLAESGKVAGHLVKYSHHPDGKAHFSQDGLEERKSRDNPFLWIIGNLTCLQFRWRVLIILLLRA